MIRSDLKHTACLTSSTVAEAVTEGRQALDNHVYPLSYFPSLPRLQIQKAHILYFLRSKWLSNKCVAKDDTISLSIEWLFLGAVRISDGILMVCHLMYSNKGKKRVTFIYYGRVEGRVMTGFMQVINRVVRWLVNVPSITPGVFLTFLKLDIYCTIYYIVL